MIPGRALHRLAAQICCANTLQRVVEPAIADLQKEWVGASAGDSFRRFWLLLRGYYAIVQVIAICALTISPVTDDERRELMRTIAWSGAMFLVVMALLMGPPISRHRDMGMFAAVTLLPQALPLAVPLGIVFGIAFGLRARANVTIAKLTLLGSVAASVFSFVILAWGIPAANHAFREMTFQQLRASGYEGPITGLRKGYREMTLSELREQSAHFAADGEPRRARQYAFGFHQKFSLAAVTLALVSMLLAVRADGRAARGAFAFAACVIYWVLMFAGDWGSRRGYLIAPLGAWLPNFVLIAVAVLAFVSSCLRGSLSVVEPSHR